MRQASLEQVILGHDRLEANGTRQGYVPPSDNVRLRISIRLIVLSGRKHDRKAGAVLALRGLKQIQ